jgi:superfamily I DNA/RNA helicase
VAVRVADGAPPHRIRAVTFNRRAAAELRERLDAVLVPFGVPPGTVPVTTFHALGLEIRRDGGHAPGVIADRMTVLRELWPCAAREDRVALDDAISRAKLDPGAGAMPDSLRVPASTYAARLASTGAIDLDDLVAGALALLRADEGLLARWRERCADLLVDEVQDVDATQLDLALTLSGPAARIFLVGDDDQSIYGWRLADVRRVIGLADRLPGLRRFDLIVNRRCPAPVVDRAVRLVSHNAERFVKVVRSRPGASGRLVLVPEGADEQRTVAAVIAGWPAAGTHAVLARTNRELLVAMAVALERRLPFRADRLPDLASDPRVDALLDAADRLPDALPPAARLLGGAARALAIDGRPPRSDDAEDGPSDPEIVAAALAWAVRHGTLGGLRRAVDETRELLASLRRDDAPLTLATVHATKGLEFDDVLVLGMSRGRFPSDRSVAASADPARTLEEERRLAYVAWTRARRSLSILFDPAAPSSFLLEAFDVDELPGAGRAGTRGRRAGRGSPDGAGSSTGVSERAPPPPRPARLARAGR